MTDLTKLLTGFIFGLLVSHIILIIERNYRFKKQIINPIKELLNLDINNFIFKKRINSDVIVYHKELEILINIQKNILYLIKDDALICSHNTDNVHYKEMIKKILIHFHKEINIDVTWIDNQCFSNNLIYQYKNINKELNRIPSWGNIKDFDENIVFDIDIILDKITKNGLNSLTTIEIEFLNKQKENS